MEMTFSKKKFFARARREGFEKDLTPEDYKAAEIADGRRGTTMNWQNMVHDKPYVWLFEDGDFEGCYVLECDCIG